ncbi:BTAD domain-containing putative transcriptional regulator [Amycolatopsis suaedae]|uniref:Helix-turn-helix domain-containing protein n=1 Tax=Amycolatopsis suaedae TaxID=2510978 RepID=A0A4Q7J3V4_9PSEU|nr:BTAD domain-containing putative transcriptional regulator [Amycolatopsis suaedae]RZQ61657.1 helix-turn-helix domain-containing protein [Amycolatopsis suaedae]
MRVRLLGPVQALADDGTPLPVGGARLRALLALLALDVGRPVSVERLVDGLWGGEPPADAANALQSLVSRLRRALPAGVLARTTAGYRLDAEDTDADRFTDLATRGRAELAADPARASALLTEALDLWHGPALADVDAPFTTAHTARLAELRLTAAEDRYDAELRLGRHAGVLTDLAADADRHPLRERLAALLMRALHAAGRQADALARFERVRAELADELGVDPSEQLREAHLAVLRGEQRPARSPAQSTVPVRLTSFVGRADECKLIAERLADHRLVTLVGPGGAGKTRLATEAVADVDRKWFVPLAAVGEADDIAAAVYDALGRWEPGPATVVDRIVEAVGLAGGGLLVLDNCEHLVDSVAALVAELLGRIGSLRILATSREPLAVTGEAVCPIGPLAVPEPGALAAEALDAPAVRLFVDRATAARPGFTLTDANAAAVAEICRGLDGMPLAIELAAARLRSMTVEQVAERLDDRFRLLASGDRAALPRQRTLRAVVEWSWDLLGDTERTLARRLSALPAGLSLAGAEAACADEVLPREDVVYLLGSLVEKSIVDSYVGAGGEPRYRMLETIRAYAAEHLAESGEHDVVLERATAWLLDRVEPLEPMLRDRRQLAAIPVYDAEYENLLAAARWAIDTGRAVPARRLVDALLWFWMLRGHDTTSASITGRILTLADRLPDDARTTYALVAAQRPFVSGPRDDERQLVDDCVRTGAVERYPPLTLFLPMVALLSRDAELLERELTRALSTTDPWRKACAMWAKGFICADRGDQLAADEARAEALAGFEAVGDRWGIASTLGMLADGRSLRGDHAGAIAAHERGIELAAELGSADDLSRQLWLLSSQRRRAGDLAGAWRDLREAERVGRAVQDRQFEVVVLAGSVELYRMEGNLAAAGAALAEAERRLTADMFPATVGEDWLNQVKAAVAMAEGRLADAETCVLAALTYSTGRRDFADVAQGAELLALLRHRQSDAADAARVLGMSEALRGVFDAGNPELTQLVAELTTELGDQGFRLHYESGSRMSKEDAVAYLLRRR